MDARLLDDMQVQRFVRDGYIALQADPALPLHEEIRLQLDEVFENEGNIGNNILPRLPQIGRVFEHPTVRGALQSLLGPGYVMNPHRHCHLNPPGGKGQAWHKDCYVFDHNMRQPRFRWVLALYYPQAVDVAMGPTALLPGRHFYEGVSDADAARSSEAPLELCGPAGSVFLVDFNAWHRATANQSPRKRYMLKFQFARMQEPGEASWDHQDPVWRLEAGEGEELVCRDVWDWLRGAGGQGVGESVSVESLLEELGSVDETGRLRAAYALGAVGQKAAAVLAVALKEEATAVEPRIEESTPDNLHATNPTALRAALGLMAMGAAGYPAIGQALAADHWLVRAAAADAAGSGGPSAAELAPALLACCSDDHWWVRRNAVEALGRLGETGEGVRRALVVALDDTDRRVRRVATLALAQLGDGLEEPGQGAVEALARVLEDKDRYNRHFAALALSRLQGQAARQILTDHLLNARWCPLTTAADRY